MILKTIIALSNFSLDEKLFSSFEDLNRSFLNLQQVKSNFNQDAVDFFVGNDILDIDWLGLSLTTQLKNFSFGQDKGVQGSFMSKLYDRYLHGFDLSYTTEELRKRSLEEPDINGNINYILYTPFLTVSESLSFKDNESFSDHYEKILSKYPVSNSSFYKRATSHFTNLIYHRDCSETLDRVADGFINYSTSFVTCLRALNEFSPTNIIDTKIKIKTINAATPYECTEEGSPHRNFKFSFAHNNRVFKSLNCEYHIKPSANNSAGDTSFHHKRLYFGFIPIADNKWRVAVAVMGPHLNKK